MRLIHPAASILRQRVAAGILALCRLRMSQVHLYDEHARLRLQALRSLVPGLRQEELRLDPRPCASFIRTLMLALVGLSMLLPLLADCPEAHILAHSVLPRRAMFIYLVLLIDRVASSHASLRMSSCVCALHWRLHGLRSCSVDSSSPSPRLSVVLYTNF